MLPHLSFIKKKSKKWHRLASTASDRKYAKIQHDIFHDFTKHFFSKHQNKAEYKDLDPSEVLSSDFSVLRTSAASMTSSASTTSIASMTSTASFHQTFCWSWWLDHPWHPNDQIDLSGLCNLNDLYSLDNLSGLNNLNSLNSLNFLLILMVGSSLAPKLPIMVPFCGMDPTGRFCQILLPS